MKQDCDRDNTLAAIWLYDDKFLVYVSFNVLILFLALFFYIVLVYLLDTSQ